MPSPADHAATVRHALKSMGGTGWIAREQAEAALDALVARCEEAERERDAANAAYAERESRNYSTAEIDARAALEGGTP